MSPLLILSQYQKSRPYYELDYHFFKVITWKENHHESYRIISLPVPHRAPYG